MNEGLSEIEAQKRLTEFGENILWKRGGFDAKRFLRENVLNLFNLLLILVFFISFFGGGKKIESFLILVFLIVSILVSFFAEFNFQKLYERLEKFLQKKVNVLRDGKIRVIRANLLVPGDIIYLSKGEKVPADGEVLNCSNLLVDEQIFTGESQPVEKKTKMEIFAGTQILEGECEIRILKTGRETKFAQIGRLALTTLKKSAYQVELEKFTRNLTKIVIVFVSALIVFHSFWGEIDKKEILSFSLILGISIIPELFPPIAVFTLTIFSKKFSERKTIIKRISAIEDLGIIDILCVDKTGTITTNELKLEVVEAEDKREFLLLCLSLTFGISQRYLSDFGFAIAKDTPQELINEARTIKLLKRRLFDPSLRISQGIIERDRKKILVVTGAPEFVLDISDFESENHKQALLRKITEYSSKGFRIYSLAIKEIEKEEFVTNLQGACGFKFMGFGVFRDALKKSAKPALILAESLGVDVKILTGDRPEVARKVALEIGLIKEHEPVFSEKELLELDEDKFTEVVEKFNVFARVSPETKYKIVKALQKNHHVGYLGEGINDLPVIKLANVSLVVDTAQDAAKEIADIILLEKDLRVIVEGIELGRRAFFNLIKFLRHTMSDNFGNFFSIGFLSFFLKFLPLTPLQILATDFITDFPLLALATDNVLPKEIKRLHGSKYKELFKLLISLGVLSALFIFFSFLIFKNYPPQLLRTVLFTTTTLTGIFVFYSIRTNEWFFKSPPSGLIHFTVFISLMLTVVLLYTPISAFFGLEILPAGTFLFLLFYCMLGFLFANDIVKKIILK